MFSGELTLCIKCEDLQQSLRFYEAMGLEQVERTDARILLKNGNTRIALMNFLDQNCLNFRGADAFEIRNAFTTAGVEIRGDPEQYTAEKYSADADGCCLSTFDPNGNNVFFDTNEIEDSIDGKKNRIGTLLRDTARDLENLGASEECLQVFEEQLIQRFG